MVEKGRVLVVHNPTAGAGDRATRVAALVKHLADRGFAPIIISDLAQLEPLANEHLAAGSLSAVVAAGGDGTAETVANLTPPGTPLAVFPLGTENLLAKYLGISASPETLAELIDGAPRIQLDAGQLTTDDGQSRLFLLMMGCGFDADVIHRLHKARRGNITHLSYARPILESIRKYDYPRLRVVCFDLAPRTSQFRSSRVPSNRQVVAHWAFVFNTPSYAIGLAICPDADPTDGYLNLVTFRGGSFWKGLYHLGNVILGRQQHSRRVHMLRAKRIRIEADTSVPFQIDGDPGGVLPVEISVQPKRLTVVVPPDSQLATIEKKGQEA